jgi:hypothetical protein
MGTPPQYILIHGRRGGVVGFDEGNGRYTVHLDGEPFPLALQVADGGTGVV